MGLFQIDFDAFCDHGTGFTTEAQCEWLADATRRVIACLHMDVAAWRAVTQHALFVDEPTKLLIETTLTEEQVRERVAKEMGRKAAYVTVRRFVGDLPAGLIHPGQVREYRGVLAEAADASRRTVAR